MTKVIGFASQFYTLWNYEAVPQYKADSYGGYHCVGVDHKYYYIKNVSTDLDKVKALHPNVPIDENLRGTTSFTRNERLNLPDGYFWAGKYAGKLIDEIMESDFRYCLWSAENFGGKISEYITSHPKYIAHFEAIEKQKVAEIESAKTLKVGDVVELEFTRNGYNQVGDSCWTEATFGDIQIAVFCGGVKRVDGRYPYLMPKINGRVQKTKYRKITVTVTEVFDTSIYRNVVYQKIKVA